MGIFGNIRNHFQQYSQFRRGIIPANPRFSDHFTREIGKIAQRYYPAADVSASRQDWNPSVLVDQNIYRLEYRRIFARAKRAYDTDPYARSCARVLQSQVVGTGITPRHKPLDKNNQPLTKLGKLLDTLWSRFSDECFRPDKDGFYDVQSKYIANLCYSGGLFLNLVPSPKNSLLPFAFQQIDQSYIEFSHDNFAIPESPFISNGVEINEFGEPQRYYFQDLMTWQFFDMPANNMIHCYEKWHANQFIGLPWFAPILTTLWDLAQLQEDKLIASRIQAAIALWVHEDNKAPNIGMKNKDGDISLAPGAIFKGRVKPEIIQSDDTIKDSLGALIELYLKQIAAGMGVSYQEMCKDTAGANFASSRTITADQRRYYRKKQMFVERSFCKPIDKKFVQWCFLTGLIPGKSITDFKANQWGYCNSIWTPQRWDWVDPLKDMNAMIAERDAGWLSDEEFCERSGKDRDVLYAILAEEKKKKEELGIQSPAIVQEATANKFPKEEENAND